MASDIQLTPVDRGFIFYEALQMVFKDNQLLIGNAKLMIV